ncbi:MAG: FkbM family methyltransferase [Rhodospirillales bacterium]|nr:FkbM family methyltransferase [Rhodospirillales bacterium]
MTNSNAVQNPAFAAFLVRSGWLEKEPFVLADVGVGGGIHECWNVFGDALHVWGFDPLEGEVEILNRENHGGRHHYTAAKVGSSDFKRVEQLNENGVSLRNDHCWDRLATMRALRLLDAFGMERYDRSGLCKISDLTVSLDDFFLDQHRPPPNFVKIDTDGFDIEVLHGSRRLLDDGRLLGLSVESQFVGNIGPTANVFSNIDTLLRNHGFTLFDLDPIRYSRGNLPMPFTAPAPVQSHGGQLIWGEALYFRDFTHADYEAMWGISPSDNDIIKLCCLFDIFALPDCAADLLVKYRDRFLPDFVNQCLDRLTPTLNGRKVSYSEYISAFEAYVQSGYDEKLFEVPLLTARQVTSSEWHSVQESLRLRDEIIASLKGIVSVHEETIKRMQEREAERMRQEMKAKGLL